MGNEVVVYNEKGIEVTKPFIFTRTGSLDFYASEKRVTVIETAPVDDMRKPFYFNMVKDENHNYEINLRFNPSRIIQNVSNVINIGNGIKSFFS